MNENTQIDNHKRWVVTKKLSNDLLEQILLNRKISQKDWASFLNPDFENGLHDPFLFENMSLVVSRIKKAIELNETIGIFADYDADGIPASVMLCEVLKRHGLSVEVYIPSRDEGYGLSHKGIDELKSKGVSLIFTVDLGIREIERINYAKNLDVDVIITDHHEPGLELPQALAIINPKLKDSKYPFRELSGGGVVFKLAQALSQKFQKINSNDLKWLLDLVCITTICDVVPLVDENRIFVKFGLVVLAKTKRIGLKKLYQVIGMDAQNINVYSVGFQIGPRLNAPGRLNKKQESFDLLKTSDLVEAMNFAIELDSINRQRQDELEKILQEARSIVFEQKLNQKKVILLAHENWPTGLIGLVAGKLVDEFSRPCIVLDKGESESRGSARSIDNYNIVDVFEDVQDLLKNFGGHSKAAGLTIANNNLKSFYDRLLEIADQKLSLEDLVPKITIDAEVKSEDLDFQFLQKIMALEPFGLANPRPVFLLTNVEAREIKVIGANNTHLKFKVDQIEAIAFGLGYLADKIKSNKFDLAFTLEENNWNGNKKLQIKVLDIKIDQVV